MFDIKRYLIDFNKNTDLPRKDGSFFIDDDIIRFVERNSFVEPNMSFNGVPMYYKNHSKEFKGSVISEIVGSLVFNNLNVNSIQSYSVVDNSNILSKPDEYFVERMITKDPGVACQYLSDSKEVKFQNALYSKIGRFLLINTLKEFMDKEQEICDKCNLDDDCFQSIVNMIILDNVMLNNDRHSGNFFVIQKNSEKKFTDIVAIDHENCKLAGITRDELFSIPFNSISTPKLGKKFERYSEKIETLNNLLHDGILNRKQIELLKSLKNIEIEKIIDGYENNTGYKFDRSLLQTYLYAFDYAQNHLSKEL